MAPLAVQAFPGTLRKENILNNLTTCSHHWVIPVQVSHHIPLLYCCTPSLMGDRATLQQTHHTARTCKTHQNLRVQKREFDNVRSPAQQERTFKLCLRLQRRARSALLQLSSSGPHGVPTLGSEGASHTSPAALPLGFRFVVQHPDRGTRLRSPLLLLSSTRSSLATCARLANFALLANFHRLVEQLFPLFAVDDLGGGLAACVPVLVYHRWSPSTSSRTPAFELVVTNLGAPPTAFPSRRCVPTRGCPP